MKNTVFWAENRDILQQRFDWGLWSVMLMFRLLLIELLFHNNICDFPSLSFSNNNCCSCIWSYTTKSVRTAGKQWLESCGQAVSKGAGSGRGAYSDSLRAHGEGLESFSSWWALWFLLQLVFIAFNKTGSKKNNLVEYQSTASNIGQWRLSVSSFVFFSEALCSWLGGLLISLCALVPNCSLESRENTWVKKALSNTINIFSPILFSPK